MKEAIEIIKNTIASVEEQIGYRNESIEHHRKSIANQEASNADDRQYIAKLEIAISRLA